MSATPSGVLPLPTTPEERDKNRRRLTTLVAAGTKLDAAARLVKEATLDVAHSGLLPREDIQDITAAIAAYLQRVNSAIKQVP
jgi:hypothetical protein